MANSLADVYCKQMQGLDFPFHLVFFWFSFLAQLCMPDPSMGTRDGCMRKPIISHLQVTCILHPPPLLLPASMQGNVRHAVSTLLIRLRLSGSPFKHTSTDYMIGHMHVMAPVSRRKRSTLSCAKLTQPKCDEAITISRTAAPTYISGVLPMSNPAMSRDPVFFGLRETFTFTLSYNYGYNPWS